VSKTPAKQGTDGLVDLLTSSLNVNADQAAGDMGAIFHYVKDNVSAEQLSQLANSIPGIEGLVSQMHDMSKLNSGGLLEQASQYSDSLKSINNVKKNLNL
jgi:hypothetical protein